MNTPLLFAVEAIVRVKGIIIIALLTNQLTVAEFGAWSQIAVLVAVFSPIVTLGTDQAILRFLPGIQKDEARSRYSGWILTVVLAALLMGVLQYIFQDHIANFFFRQRTTFCQVCSLSNPHPNSFNY